MRVKFVVTRSGQGWRVSRGHTSPMDYPSLERAVAAAENFARRAVERGESALVEIVADEMVETRRFEAEGTRPLERRTHLADERPARTAQIPGADYRLWR